MTTITIDLDEEHSARLKALSGRTGFSADAVLCEALEVFASALDQVEESPPFSAEQIAAIEAGLAAADRGELVPHEEVFAELREKFG